MRRIVRGSSHMALQSPIHKAQLEISDMDRGYYANHALTLAQHPSETTERLMVRVLAFAMHADERREFGAGLSSDDEPDLWRKSLTGEIEQWIDLGQPDEQRIRKACGRARQVIIVTYSGRSADLWWQKIATGLARSRNLTVIDVPSESAASLAALAGRNMQLQCLIQEGDVQLMDAHASASITPSVRMAPASNPR